MTNLTKLQFALLRSACQRPDGYLLPAPAALSVAPNRIRKAVGQLVELGLATECDSVDPLASWRVDGERLVGAAITDAGRQHFAGAEPAPTASPARPSKNSLLVELLSRADGVSIEELVAATSWQPHTARAAITILKTRKGQAVERFGERGASRYRIASAG